MVSKHLETLDIDFACIQEDVQSTGRFPTFTTSSKTSKSLRLPYVYFSQILNIKICGKDFIFGNGTYSKNESAESSTIFTRGSYIADYIEGEDDYNVRAFEHTVYEIGGKKLNIINHHGHHINEHKLGNDETMRQMSQIHDYAKVLDGAIIICGDFNLEPESRSIQLLDQSFRNLSVEHELKTTRSLLTTKKEVCDYIFVNDQVTVNKFYMDETIVSDHNGLVLDFDLKA